MLKLVKGTGGDAARGCQQQKALLEALEPVEFVEFAYEQIDP
jgi:hypothetical protein